MSATLAAAAAVMISVWPDAPSTEVASIATPVGTRRDLQLSDGSRLELNARTSIVVETTPAERRVRLASGEAFFSVSKDPERPFIVETPAGSVRVTGTRFNVKSQGGTELQVTVLEGSVQVRPGEGQTSAGAAPVSLETGGRFAADAKGNSVSKVSDSDLDRILAWRQGQIIFENTPLSEALAQFAYHHGRGISAADGVAALTIGGRYGLDDLEGFFTALEEILPVQVLRDLSGTVRVVPRPAE